MATLTPDYDELLFDAINKRDWKEVHHLLDLGTAVLDLHKKHGPWETLSIHEALSNGAPVEIVTRLVEMCPSSLLVCGGVEIPLHYALRLQTAPSAGVVRVLTEACPRSLTMDGGAGTPLGNAFHFSGNRRPAGNRRPDNLERMLPWLVPPAVKDPGFDGRYWPRYYPGFEAQDWIRSATWWFVDKYGKEEALLMACQVGAGAVVRWFLNHYDVDINFPKNKDNKRYKPHDNPLYRATQSSGNEKLVIFLLEQGAIQIDCLTNLQRLRNGDLHIFKRGIYEDILDSYQVAQDYTDALEMVPRGTTARSRLLLAALQEHSDKIGHVYHWLCSNVDEWLSFSTMRYQDLS